MSQAYKTQRNSPFFTTLPPEIRTQIYSHLLKTTHPISPQYLPPCCCARQNGSRALCVAIVLTCHVCAYEASAILYGDNTIEARNRGELAELKTSDKKCLPRYLEKSLLIRRLSLKVGMYCRACEPFYRLDGLDAYIRELKGFPMIEYLAVDLPYGRGIWDVEIERLTHAVVKSIEAVALEGGLQSLRRLSITGQIGLGDEEIEALLMRLKSFSKPDVQFDTRTMA